MVRNTGLEFRKRAGLESLTWQEAYWNRLQGEGEVKKLRQDRQFLKWIVLFNFLSTSLKDTHSWFK